MTKPNEPTLTCSEVVERLATECCVFGWDAVYDETFTFNRELATAILHSWRERRVQELEEALSNLMSVTNPARLIGHNGVWTEAERVLKSEQIRKGAKHE